MDILQITSMGMDFDPEVKLLAMSHKVMNFQMQLFHRDFPTEKCTHVL